MMNREELEVYYTNCKAIFNYYGRANQKQKLIEECQELIQAIMKNDKENIIEEMADVQVLIDQFTIENELLDEKIESIKQYKVNRQICRIHSELN